MARDFLDACDNYQLGVFATMLFLGLRASEPAFLFREYLDRDRLTVRCVRELDYATKGRRDKRAPLLPPLRRLLGLDDPTRVGHGLLLVRRTVNDGKETPPLLGASLQRLIGEYDHRCQQLPGADVKARQAIRDVLVLDAGGLNYNRIRNEFDKVARLLGWPKTATPKGFRRLFATSMANAGMQEHERRYLLEHASGRDAITTYTHLDRLNEHYGSAVKKVWGPLLEIIEHRRAQ